MQMGRGRERNSKFRKDLQWNKMTAKSPLEKRQYERNVKRHYNLLFSETTNQVLIQLLLLISQELYVIKDTFKKQRDEDTALFVSRNHLSKAERSKYDFMLE